MNYDVIMAGGGFSGVACARRLSLAGLSVLLLDPRPPEQFGAPYSSVMLDVDTFSKTGLERPQGEELLHLLDQFYAYSPSGRVKKPIDFSALLVNGQRLLQRLLAEAQAAGLAVQQDAACPLYTAEAADEERGVGRGGCCIIDKSVPRVNSRRNF